MAKNNENMDKKMLRLKTVAVFFSAGFLFLASSASATIYYVDNTISDTNIASATADCDNYNLNTFLCDGGAASAFATVADINSSTFLPGDQILFRKGQTFREELTVPSSGTDGSRIVFGSYGTGLNPKFNGSSLLNNAGFSPYAVEGPLIFSATPGSNLADGATRNYRQIATVNKNSNTIKIRLTASDSANWVIAGVSIGARSSGASANSLTRVTWNGGSNGVTISAGTAADSDEINFPVVSGNTYLVHVYMTARNLKFKGSGSEGYYYDAIASDETTVTSPTGSQLATFASGGGIVTAIIGDEKTIWSTTTLPSYSVSQITSTGTTATVTTPTAHHLIPNQWITVKGADQAGYNLTVQVSGITARTFNYTVAAGLVSPATGTITYEMAAPAAVWEDNVFLAKQASIVNVGGGAGRWYFDTTTRTLYVNGFSQNDPTTNGKTYEIPHLHHGIFDNLKNYIEIKEIDCLQSIGVPDQNGVLGGSGMSGIYLRGSNNIVHDLETYNTGRHGFSFYTGSNNNIGYNLSIHDDVSTTPVTIFGTDTTNNTLRNSSIYQAQLNSSNGNLVLHGLATGNIVEKNDFYNSSNTSVLIQSYDTGTDSNIIRYNNFRDAFAQAIYIHLAGTGAPSGDIIYGNLINGSIASSDPIFLNNSGGHFVYNNTIITPNSSSYAGIKLAGSANVTIKNNIFYGPYSINVSDITSESGFVSDYNDFYGISGTKWNWGGTDYTTLAAWQGISSQDINSLNSNPLFTNIASSDYSILSTSPARDAGVDLGNNYANALSSTASWPSSVPTISQNVSGLDWDIGAYAYTQSTPPVISIISPLPNSSVAWGNVFFSAETSAASLSAISSVQYRVDGSDFGSAITTAPYEFSYSEYDFCGGHTVTAIATDNYGNSTTSSPVVFSVVCGSNAPNTSNKEVFFSEDEIKTKNIVQIKAKLIELLKRVIQILTEQVKNIKKS